MSRLRFQELVRRLTGEEDHRCVLAELNDLLTELTSTEFSETVREVDLTGVTPFLSNYAAAMVEQAAASRELPPPPWVRSVPPLERPYFSSPLKSHRLHLLRASPVPFKRRNLFIDATLGDRV